MQLHRVYSYQIDEHPDTGAVYEWIRSNWHDLGNYSVDEGLESLKGFSNYFSTSLDYSISIVSDRGEYISTVIDDIAISELSGARLFKYLTNNYDLDKLLSGNCPFTGMVYDETLLDDIRGFIRKPDDRDFQELINNCTHKLLSAIHDEGEYIYSDEGLHDLCQANEYEFTADGHIY